MSASEEGTRMGTTGARVPPGPTGKPFVGVGQEMQRDIVTKLMEGFRQYGDIVRFPIPRYEIYLLGHPDHVKHVLQDNNKNYPKIPLVDNKFMRISGEGLLTASGPHWMKQRRLVQPAFHRQRIRGFAEIIDGQYFGPAHSRYRERAAEIVANARSLLEAAEDLDFAARLQSARARPAEGTDLKVFFPAFAEALLARVQAGEDFVRRQSQVLVQHRLHLVEIPEPVRVGEEAGDLAGRRRLDELFDVPRALEPAMIGRRAEGAAVAVARRGVLDVRRGAARGESRQSRGTGAGLRSRGTLDCVRGPAGMGGAARTARAALRHRGPGRLCRHGGAGGRGPGRPRRRRDPGPGPVNTPARVLERLEDATRLVSRNRLSVGIAILFLITAGLLASSQIGPEQSGLLLIVAAVIGGYMALTIGANDVANNVSPAVGARALTMTGALAIYTDASVRHGPYPNCPKDRRVHHRPARHAATAVLLAA